MRNIDRERLSVNWGRDGVRSDVRDGVTWVCLTDVARLGGKQLSSWKRKPAIGYLLSCLENAYGYPVITSRVGYRKDPQRRGTWAIEPIAVALHRWIEKQSPDAL